MLNQNLKQKGFTLIELLVVIAIVAILAVVVILTLNPAELLKQARDSNRIQDLNTLKAGISQYLADVTSPSLGTANTCYVSNQVGTWTAGSGACGLSGTYTAIGSSSAANNRKVDSNGWIPINFSAISSGAPFGQLPVDPVNTGTNLYRYAPTVTSTQLTFKLAAPLESNKYGLAGSTTTVAGADGGSTSTMYETGTDLTL